MHRNHPQQSSTLDACQTDAGKKGPMRAKAFAQLGLYLHYIQHASDRGPSSLTHGSLHTGQTTRTTARPETHQPLHTDKEQSKYQTQQNHADASAPCMISKIRLESPLR